MVHPRRIPFESHPEPQEHLGSQTDRETPEVVKITGMQRSFVDYDESECVSDTSFASESCTSAKSRAKSTNAVCRSNLLFKSTQKSRVANRRGLSRPSSAKKPADDPIVRTGSALFDAHLLSSDDHATPIPVATSECDELRKRISELEKQVLHSKQNASSTSEVLLEYQAENQRLLSRIAEMSSSHASVSLGISAVKETCSQQVEAIMGCPLCPSLQSELVRYRESAGEAARIGEELTKVLEERDKLKNELKRVKQSQSQERIKTVLNENDKLKEALKKRFPSNFTSLVTFNPEANTELQTEKDRNRELEAKIERIDEQWKRRLENLRANHDSIKAEYEKTINSLMDQKRPRLPPPSLEVPKIDIRENEVLKKRIADLESRIESLKQFHSFRNRKIQSTNTQTVQRFRDICLTGFNLKSDLAPSCPPLPTHESEVSLSEWANLLRAVLVGRNRIELANELIDSDYRRSGLVEKNTFVRTLAHNLTIAEIQALVDVYGFGDDQVDYKSFLSDLATRHNVFISDLERENAALRNHVDSLVEELREKIESFENDPLAQSLRNANEEIERKDNELKMYKTELNRFLTRNIRRVGLGE